MLERDKSASKARVFIEINLYKTAAILQLKISTRGDAAL
jgi:hypothetical protein